MSDVFYVYEHWRPDTNQCFYVGKGQGRRAYALKKGRNRYHKAISSKLEQNGLSVEVRIIAEGLPELLAFAIEICRIAIWRGEGVPLANIANGGEGCTGLKLSPEQRRRIGELKRGNKYRLGAKLSEETKRKIGEKHAGRTLSEEHKKKVAQSLSGEKNPFFGKTHSKETRERVAEANKRRVWSDESRQKLSATHRAKPPRTHNPSGWRHSEEAKKRYSEAAKLRWAKKRAQDAARDAAP